MKVDYNNEQLNKKKKKKKFSIFGSKNNNLNFININKRKSTINNTDLENLQDLINTYALKNSEQNEYIKKLEKITKEKNYDTINNDVMKNITDQSSNNELKQENQNNLTYKILNL